MYLLDSNILIYLLKGQGQVKQHLQSKSPQHIKVPAPALFELEYGTAKSQRPQLQRDFIDAVVLKFDILPLDYRSAKAAGVLRSGLEGKGNLIGPYDLLIAGIAIANDLTVITRNTREFARVPGLRVENWYD
jgi:tRNA(fMet)-specific endonuclease VapC